MSKMQKQLRVVSCLNPTLKTLCSFIFILLPSPARCNSVTRIHTIGLLMVMIARVSLHQELGRSFDWSKSILFSGAIPWQAFIMWLANLNKLPTKVRMSSWGLNVQTAYCFCNNHGKSRDHLLLSCSYTASLWRPTFASLDRHHTPFISWSKLTSWIRVSVTSAPSTVKKLATQSLLNNTWRQCNWALHLNGFAPLETTFNLINRDIHNVINAIRYRRKFPSLMKVWIQCTCSLI